MKICMISSYPPEKEGVGIFTKKLVDALRGLQVPIEVLTYHDANATAEPLVHRVLSGKPLSVFEVYHSLNTLRPDLIHLQYATPVYRIYALNVWLGLLLYKRRNKQTKIVLTFHEVKRELDILKYPGVLYYRLMSLLADTILVHTSIAKGLLVNRCKVEAAKIHTINLGLYEFKNPPSSTYKNELIQTLNIRDKDVLLYFGFIHPDKGVHHLLEAINILMSENPALRNKVQLVLAGSVRPRKGIFKIFGQKDLTYYENLKSLVAKYGLEDSVSFIGYIEESHMSSLFNLAKIFVMPYTNVEQSGVLNVALAAKVPIVASNIGGLKEVLEGNGTLFQAGNEQELASKLAALLTDKKAYEDALSVYSHTQTTDTTSTVASEHQRLYAQLKVHKG